MMKTLSLLSMLIVSFSIGSFAQVLQTGGGTTYFICSDSSVWVSGTNASGTFGDSTNISSSIPVQNSVERAVKVSSFGGHGMYLTDDCTIWASGTNADGQLGDGNFISGGSNPNLVHVIDTAETGIL